MKVSREKKEIVRQDLSEILKADNVDLLAELTAVKAERRDFNEDISWH